MWDRAINKVDVRAREKQRQLIDKMVEREEGISHIYSAYADRFPIQKAFWAGLAAEEMQHADWLRKLELKVEEHVLFVNDRFKIEVIEDYLRYLLRELTRAKEGELSLTEALATTVNIEDSLLELRFFEVFETDSIELKRVLLGLANATRVHREKAREALAKHKQSQ